MLHLCVAGYQKASQPAALVFGPGMETPADREWSNRRALVKKR
jgi:hypothetical protein